MAETIQSSVESQFLVYNAQGLYLWSIPTTKEPVQSLETDSKPIDVVASEDSRYLLVMLKNLVKVYECNDLEKAKYEFLIPEVRHVSISPKSSVIQVYSSPVPDGKNLKLFSISNGDIIHEWIDKKRELVRWSQDESIAHRMVGSEILFYENQDFSKCLHKISQQKITDYAFATNSSGCSFVSVFIKGQKSQPSIIKVHGYPYLENAIVSKSFFRVDNVDIKWNQKADAMLVLASNDYDTSGKSYYGETLLHYLDLRGNVSNILGKKEGTVSAAEWLPNGESFIVIQGKIPSTITLYNSKAETLHCFGEAPVNGIFFNPFGSLVAFTGFGNLSGYIYIWNLKTKTLIAHFKAVDSTFFLWTKDGLHIITGTHYDRLKMGNGFKVWDYLGNMLQQEDCRDVGSVPLFKIFPFDSKKFPEPHIEPDVKGKILNVESEKKYVPPSLRNNSANNILAGKAPPPPPPSRKIIAKSNESSKKNNEAIKEKKLKNLNKKLQQIENLKKLVTEGKQLEKNQLEKIDKESEILTEISLLQL